MVHVLVPGDDCGGGDGGERGEGPRGDFMSENWGWGIVLTMEAVLVSVATWEILLVVWGRSMAATWDQVRPANLTRLLILLTFIGFQNK